MQQFLKAAARAARAEVVAAEFFEKFFIGVNDAVAALYVRFGRIALSTFTRVFERRIGGSFRGALAHLLECC
jgi:hypothetical protein